MTKSVMKAVRSEMNPVRYSCLGVRPAELPCPCLAGNIVCESLASRLLKALCFAAETHMWKCREDLAGLQPSQLYL